MATHVRSRGVQTQPSTALRLKCEREYQKLRAKLDLQLKNDMNRCFEDSAHSDFTFITKAENITVHVAILQTRVPRLFRVLQSQNNPGNFCYVPQIQAELLKSLLRKIYIENYIEEEENFLIDYMFRVEEAFSSINSISDKMTDSGVSNDSCNVSLTTSVDNKWEHCDNSKTDSDSMTMDTNTEHMQDDSGIDDFLPTNIRSRPSQNEKNLENVNDDFLSFSKAISESMSGSTCSNSLFTNELNISLSSDSKDCTLSKELEEVQNGGTETDDTLDQEAAGSDCSEDKVRTLIRRDTFDLIEPSVDDEENFQKDSDAEGDDVKENDSVIVWEVGGDLFSVKKSDNDAQDNEENNAEVDERLITSTIANDSSGSERINSSETPTKDEGLQMLSASASTDDGVSLSSSFTATMYNVFAPNNEEISEHPNDENESTEFIKTEQICMADLGTGARPKELINLHRTQSYDGKLRTNEMYFCSTPDIVDNYAKSPVNGNTNDKAAVDDATMKHSNSKLFSPDSIISDRSPILERTTGLMHNTVQILPILTDYEIIHVDENRSEMDNKIISRKSSDSLSPDADSLNVDPITPNTVHSKILHNSFETSSKSVSVIAEVDEKNQDSVSDTNEISVPNKIQNNVQRELAEDKKMIENVPVLSGFNMTVSECVEQKQNQESASKPGSFFVFIDVNDTPLKNVETCKIEMTARRRRITSGTSEDESLSINRSLSIDTSRKDSYSEDDTQSDRSSKLGTSPKTPSSVYMYIEAGSSPKPTTTKRSHHVPRPLSQEITSSPPAKGHVRKLSQGHEPLFMGTFDIPLKSNTAQPAESKDKFKTPERDDVLYSEKEDESEMIYSEFSESPKNEEQQPVNNPEEDYNSIVQVPCSKLGEDLLRMFLEEINTDVIVRVDSKDIKAHKCILSSRCSYFAAMLSGGWLESSGNIISLHGFSYTVVHFTLCHIYSGATTLPEDVNITELASIADMMGLEGLKDVVALTLKAKYCHFFHKPCSECIVGVLECLPISASYGLEELYDKCIRWITRHMARTWPTKAFATLPEELMNKSYHSAKADIGVDNVLDTVMTCDKLMATLPSVKWAESVFGLTSKLLEACTIYLAKNLHSILISKKFLALGKGQSWNVNALEDSFMAALDNLTLDSACLSYVTVEQLLGKGENSIILDGSEFIENFIELLQKVQRQVERFLIHNANRVVHCPSWSKLTPLMQKRIKEAAVIVFEFGKPTAPPPRLSSLNRQRFTRGKTHSPAEHSESSTTSSSSGRTAGSKRFSHSAASPVTKNTTYPLPSRMAITPPAAKQSGMHVRKSPGDSLRSLTPAYEGRKSSTPIKDDTPSSKSNKGSAMTLPLVARNSETSNSQLRKYNSRERVGSSRPKSWPVKEKTVVAKTKETKEVRLSNSSSALRTSSTLRTKMNVSSRPKSAVSGSDSTSTEAARSTHSNMSCSLREGKGTLSKNKQASDTSESSVKTRAGDKTCKSHATSSSRRNTDRDDGKVTHSSTISRRNK